MTRRKNATRTRLLRGHLAREPDRPESKQRRETHGARESASQKQTYGCNGCVTPASCPDVDVYVRVAPASFGTIYRPSTTSTTSVFFFLLLLCLPLLLLKACPPLSLTTRCRRTRDLRGAEPPKTITKCQGCHCATRMGCARGYLRSRTQSRYLASPLHSPTLSSVFPSLCLLACSLAFPRPLNTAVAVPLSQQ